MDPAIYQQALKTNAASLAAAGRTDLSAVVASCPGWTVRDVLTHVAGVHRWCRRIVESGQRADFEAPPAELDDEALVQWAEEQTAALVDTFSGTDPDRDVWTFGQPRTVRFWLRRQAHETAIHAWDASAAIGAAPELDSALAADGLDEFLDQMLPRLFGGTASSWGGETIHFHRTDGEGEWLVALGPGSSYQMERSHGRGDAALRGTAGDLWLWGLNRVDATRLETYGDDDLLQRWTKEVSF